jgi:hypothetical protein
MNYFQVLNLILNVKTLNIIVKGYKLNEDHLLSEKNSYQIDKTELHYES